MHSAGSDGICKRDLGLVKAYTCSAKVTPPTSDLGVVNPFKLVATCPANRYRNQALMGALTQALLHGESCSQSACTLKEV